jgi:glycerol-3-phosphate dehydrogenase subunit C
MKKEKYPIAKAVGAPLFDRIKASGAPEAACDSETCRWHIEKATGTRTRHPIEILLQAYRVGDAAGGTKRGPVATAGT